MPMAASGESRWMALGDTAHGLLREGRIVAIVYAYNTGSLPTGGVAWELWWLPADDPEAGEVLGGRGGTTAAPSADGWAWAERTAEWLYAEWLDESDRPTSAA